jgi:hypothetical protein
MLRKAAAASRPRPTKARSPQSIRPNPSGSIDKVETGRNYYSEGFAESPQQRALIPRPLACLTGCARAVAVMRPVVAGGTQMDPFQPQ